MTILCVGDIHIKPNNAHLVDLLEQQIIQYIQNKHIQLVVLLGDILDTFERIHTQALNRAYQLIDAIRKHTQVFILVGNHDYINNQQFQTTQHWMNALKDWKNVVVIDQAYVWKQMIFVPYVPVKRFVEALESLEQVQEFQWQNALYIFAHQEFKGCKMGAIVSSEGDEWLPEWPMVISGHIHDRQQPQPNVYYIGASLQNSFGDQTLPVLLWIDPYSRTHTELALDLPRKKTIYADIQNIQDLSIDQMVEQANIDMVRIVVKCDYEEFKVFSQTKQYETLQAHTKCKIVHKIPDPKPTTEPDSSIPSLNLVSNFDELLHQKVLYTKDVYLWCMYNEVVHDTYIDPKDILIV